MKLRVIVMVVVVGLLAMSACGSAESPEGAVQTEVTEESSVAQSQATPESSAVEAEPAGTALRAIRDSQGSAEFVFEWDDAVDYTAAAARGEVPFRDVVILRGHFDEVVLGPAHSWELTEEGAIRREVEPSTAMIQMVEVGFSPTMTLVGEPGEGPIEIGLAMRPDVAPQAVQSDLTGLGDVVVFLFKSAVTDYDPTLWTVVLDNAMIAAVDPESQTLSFPAAEEGLQTVVFGERGQITLDDIVAAAAG